MTAPVSLRLVAELHDDTSWELRVSDLDDFVQLMGSDLLAAFLCCFTHADRIVSLVTMFHLSQADTPKGSPGELRNFSTFVAFLIGSLRELASALTRLRTELIARDLHEPEAWQAGLARWEQWGNTGRAKTFRKKYSFHTDVKLYSSGLESLAQPNCGKAPILSSSSHRQRHGRFSLADNAAMEGLALLQGTPDIIGEPVEYLAVTAPLEREFLRVIEKLGLKPLLVRVHGA